MTNLNSSSSERLDASRSPERRLRRMPGTAGVADATAASYSNENSEMVNGLSYDPQPANFNPKNSFSFPSSDDVTASTTGFPFRPVRSSATIRGEEIEGFEFSLSVSPGTVALGVSSPIRKGKAAERAVEARRKSIDMDVSVLLTDGALPSDRPSEREIIGWSAKSRTRMIRSYAEHDFTPLFVDGQWPAMITLTMPGCWLTVAPTGKVFKTLFDKFRKRYQFAWGEPLRCLWKQEFQGRQERSRCTCETCDGLDDGRAPHLHLFMAPPIGQSLTRGHLAFPEWLSLTWASVVNHPDPEHRRRHELAGTAVDYRQGLSASDPKRLAVYFSKHGGSAGGKEYQHLVPLAWTAPGAGPGRFWGVLGLERVTASVSLSAQDFYTVRRILRRWSRSQVFYGDYGTTIKPRTRYIMADRTNTRTGAVTKRKQTVRSPLFRQSTLQGGFAAVNDGPAIAAVIAQALKVSDLHRQT